MQRFLILAGIPLCAGLPTLTEHPTSSRKWWLEQEGFFGNLAETDASSYLSGKGPRKVQPIFQAPGMSFNGQSDYMDIGPSSSGGHVPVITTPLGGDGFSFYAQIKLSRLRPWARIFDFGSRDNKYNIVAGIIGNSNKIYFEVHNDDNHMLMHSSDLTITPGSTNSYLFTVKQSGSMQIWRDGYLLKEKTGIPVPRVDRPNLYIGKPNFVHPDGDDSYFSGTMTDIKVFNSAVDWSAVTEEKKTLKWPGLTNGDFDPMQETYQIETYTEAIPFGWIGRGKTMLCSSRGVEMLGGSIPDVPVAKLFAAIEGKDSALRQTISFLKKGKTYWIAFRAAVSSMRGSSPHLTVQIDGTTYLSSVNLGGGQWTQQLLSFTAERDDGKAELNFLNAGGMNGQTPERVFIGDVRISDFPDCYEKFYGQSTCVFGSSKTFIKKMRGHSEEECRKQCEVFNCKYLLYDPITYEGPSYCALFPECGVLTSYYGGEAGTLFKHVPCALGGVMSPSAARTYKLPEDPTKLKASSDAVHGNGTNSSNSSNASDAGYYYGNGDSTNPRVGNTGYFGRDEASSASGNNKVHYFAHPGTAAGQGQGIGTGHHSAALTNEVDFPAAPSDLGLHNA